MELFFAMEVENTKQAHLPFSTHFWYKPRRQVVNGPGMAWCYFPAVSCSCGEASPNLALPVHHPYIGCGKGAAGQMDCGDRYPLTINVDCTLMNVDCTLMNFDCTLTNLDCPLTNVDCTLTNVDCTLTKVSLILGFLGPSPNLPAGPVCPVKNKLFSSMQIVQD